MLISISGQTSVSSPGLAAVDTTHTGSMLYKSSICAKNKRFV